MVGLLPSGCSVEFVDQRLGEEETMAGAKDRRDAGHGFK